VVGAFELVSDHDAAKRYRSGSSGYLTLKTRNLQDFGFVKHVNSGSFETPLFFISDHSDLIVYSGHHQGVFLSENI